MWISLDVSGCVSIAAAIASRCRLVADSPMSRLFISIDEVTAMTASNTPMAI